MVGFVVFRPERSDSLAGCPCRAPGRRLLVGIDVGIQQLADHSLILRLVLGGMQLEEVGASLAERDRDLDALVAERELIGRRKEVRHQPIFPPGTHSCIWFSRSWISFPLRQKPAPTIRMTPPRYVKRTVSQHTPVNDGYQPYGVFAIFTYGF